MNKVHVRTSNSNSKCILTQSEFVIYDFARESKRFSVSISKIEFPIDGMSRDYCWCW